MGKTSKEDISDDLEIISIGKLYTGPWDKKYWSSSRGKDRYPYPVGYKSVRTQNGVTYTMEIVEGLKGPSFRISSTDGKSCSESTPDIACDSFQKKVCSKLWHAKRFSCKIDGVEFFGFKNTFVQRLLRELVANVGGTSEQKILSTNFTGKRSRTEKVVSSKRLNRTYFKQNQQEECIKNVASSTSKQRDQSNCRGSELSTFVAPSEDPRGCSSGPLGPDNLDFGIEKEKCLSIADRGVKMDSLDISGNLKVGGPLPEEERKLAASINHLGLDIDDAHKIQEPSDRSESYEVQESILMTEERDQTINVHPDTQVFNDTDLCVADTLDYTGDSYPSSLKKDVEVDCIAKDEIVNDVRKPKFPLTDSLPEDEIGRSAYNTNVQMCDTDSVGHEIAKSMMTVLLPRAVPLLKIFSRRKRKNVKPSETFTRRSQEERDFPNISMNDATIARELAEHSDLVRKNEKACLPCADHDAVMSTSGNSDSVVPDSFDNDGNLLHHADAAQAGQLSLDPNPRALLPKSFDAEANPLPCHSGSKRHDTGTDVTFVAATETPAPATGVTANTKQVRFDCHSIDSLPSTHAFAVNTTTSESIMCGSPSDICIPEIPSTSCCGLTDKLKLEDYSRSNIQQKVKLNRKPQDLLELFACYAHFPQISMVQLIVKQNEIFTCVKCGCSEHEEDTLFVYKALKKGEKRGCPSLIGHVPIALHISKSPDGRDIAFERSVLQLIPDGQSLALLNSIKLPGCRESKLHCSCPACTSDSCEENAVKIVRLNKGYASVVTRLKTTQVACCLLVCEPNFLLAAEGGGRLKLWVMNSGWSGPEEDWYLPAFDCIIPSIAELQTVPKSAVLVVGHNGLGEFGIWDIVKRNLVSRFSSPGMSVSECIPVSVFRWKRKGEYKIRALVDEIMDATKMSFSGRGDKNLVFSPEDKNVAVWLLMSTAFDPDSQCYRSSEEESNVGRCWRLALLANNRVITGSFLDEGAAAAATFGGHGIIGRHDGQVYVWELSTGIKLGNLLSFNGSRVSCIAKDVSNSGALAIASEGNLQVYLPA